MDGTPSSEATGFRVGNLRQVTQNRSNLPRRQTRCPAPPTNQYGGERRSGSAAEVLLCPRMPCPVLPVSRMRPRSAVLQRPLPAAGASASAARAKSPEGRLDHRDRQRHYRARCRRARVTDHGSISIACSALSSCEPDPALPSAPPLPAPPLPIRLCCRICGRPGRFINPFPVVPRRR
jgi:hypothetical protein